VGVYDYLEERLFEWRTFCERNSDIFWGIFSNFFFHTDLFFPDKEDFGEEFYHCEQRILSCFADFWRLYLLIITKVKHKSNGIYFHSNKGFVLITRITFFFEKSFFPKESLYNWN